jgi:hypothetical protein
LAEDPLRVRLAVEPMRAPGDTGRASSNFMDRIPRQEAGSDTG